MKLFLQKKCKIFERWGLRPHTPVPPAAGGFAPKPPASGGWGLRPQTPIGLRRLGAPPPDPQNSPPHCEFLATRLPVAEYWKHFDAIICSQFIQWCFWDVPFKNANTIFFVFWNIKSKVLWIQKYFEVHYRSSNLILELLIGFVCSLSPTMKVIGNRGFSFLFYRWNCCRFLKISSHIAQLQCFS